MDFRVNVIIYSNICMYHLKRVNNDLKIGPDI